MRHRQNLACMLAVLTATAMTPVAEAQDLPALRGTLATGDAPAAGINIFDEDDEDDLRPADSFANRGREDENDEDRDDSDRLADDETDPNAQRRTGPLRLNRSRAQPGLDPTVPRQTPTLPRRRFSNADPGLDPSQRTLSVPPRVATGPGVPNTGAPARPRPPESVVPEEDDSFEPLGTRISGLIIRPSLGLSGIVTDNVSEVEVGRETDFGGRVQPVIEIESDFVRHRFTLNGEGDLIFFAGEPDENEFEINVDGRLSLDIRSTTRYDIFANWALTQTSSNSLDTAAAAIGERPDNFFTFGNTVSQTFNRLVVNLTGQEVVAIFGDDELAGGGIDDNSDRNFLQPGVTLRASYELSPAIRPFAEVGFNVREFFEEIDDDGFMRDSIGGFAEAGIEFDFSGIWTGSVGAAYRIRDIEDPALETVDVAGLEADVTWRPTRVASVNLTTGTSLTESGTLDVSQIRNYNTSLLLRHQLRRNLNLRADAGLFVSEFVGIGETEFDVEAGLQLAYSIRRGMDVFGQYEFEYFNGADGLETFENRFTIGITAGL